MLTHGHGVMPIAHRIAVVVLLAVAGTGSMSAQEPVQQHLPGEPIALAAEAVANPPGLPAIGRWMITRDGTIAHWLGEIVNGKRLHEPINVILIDERAASADDARLRLIAAATVAGFPIRFGHSTGYRGFIGGALYSQLPQGRDDAFSNRIFEESNNHGRIFGPHHIEGGYVFTGAFSRERVNLLEWPGHRYASFNDARSAFALGLDERTAFKASGFVPLDNAVNDAEVTTGDHDGRAVVLRARK
jgi:hypothetical protein